MLTVQPRKRRSHVRHSFNPAHQRPDLAGGEPTRLRADDSADPLLPSGQGRSEPTPEQQRRSADREHEGREPQTRRQSQGLRFWRRQHAHDACGRTTTGPVELSIARLGGFRDRSDFREYSAPSVILAMGTPAIFSENSVGVFLGDG